MQDRYAGDIGDFGKLGLLKHLIFEGFCVGVNWYKTEPPKSERKEDGTFVQNDGKYRIKPEYFPCDPELAEELLRISESESRSVRMIQDAALLEPSMVRYYADPIFVDKRAEWHKAVLLNLQECDLVFLDPDNGLRARSIGPRSAKSVKYVFEEELEEYLRSGKSVMLYSHRPRKKEERYFADMLSRFEALKQFKGKKVYVMTCPKGTIRDYFLIAANEAHACGIEKAITQMEQSLWGKMKLCRISMPRCG